MNVKECPACQTRLDEDAIFCNECGLALVYDGTTEIGSSVLGSLSLNSDPEVLPHVEPSSTEVIGGAQGPKAADSAPSFSRTRDCRNCGKRNKESARFCAGCAAELTTTLVKTDQPIETITSSDGTVFQSAIVRKVGTRYRDAYYYARFIETVGKVLKAIGFIGGALALLAGLVISGETSRYAQSGAGLIALIPFLIYGALWAFIWWVWGVLWAAAGQLLKATLDTAVCSSPFLTDGDRAEIMSLIGSAESATGQSVPSKVGDSPYRKFDY